MQRMGADVSSQRSITSLVLLHKMFDGQNDGGMMNKQTLFVKVSDISGADMLSQNPYSQILTGEGVLEFSLC